MPKQKSELIPIAADAVAEAIVERLIEKEMTLKELGNAVGVTQQNVSAWLKNGVLPVIDLWAPIERTLESAVFDVVRDMTRGWPQTKLEK